MALCFIEAKLWQIEILHFGNTHFRPFCSCDLGIYHALYIRTWPVFSEDVTDV